MSLSITSTKRPPTKYLLTGLNEMVVKTSERPGAVACDAASLSIRRLKQQLTRGLVGPLAAPVLRQSARDPRRPQSRKRRYVPCQGPDQTAATPGRLRGSWAQPQATAPCATYRCCRFCSRPEQGLHSLPIGGLRPVHRRSFASAEKSNSSLSRGSQLKWRAGFAVVSPRSPHPLPIAVLRAANGSSSFKTEIALGGDVGAGELNRRRS